MNYQHTGITLHLTAGFLKKEVFSIIVKTLQKFRKGSQQFCSQWELERGFNEVEYNYQIVGHRLKPTVLNYP